MHIQSLILEVTRRCNLQCRHCLRGPAQAKNMSFETIRKALEGVNSIGNVTFTGGEPALNVKAIEYFTDYIRGWHIRLGSFYVVTNGKIASRSLVKALGRLAWICDEISHDGDFDCGGLVMSRDQFHKELGYDQTRARELYGKYAFYHDDERAHDIEMPIYEGFAVDNGVGVRDPQIDHPVVTKDDSYTGVEGTVYVNVNGDVIPSCDMSYESQELEKIGNVHKANIFDIISGHADSLQEVA